MSAQARLLMSLAAGFGVWAVGFTVIYGVQGLGCAHGWDDVDFGPLSMLRALLLVLVLATLAAIGLVAMRLRAAYRRSAVRDDPRMLILAISSAAAWVAVPAAAATFAGVVGLTAC